MGNAVLLAVDDRPDNLFVLEQLMAAYLSDIKLLTAPSAEAGLKLAASENIDGALIDVQMPVMNGIEMCRRLKADPLTAPIHIILMTAHRCTSTLKAQGLEAGADDFLSKPIDNVELAAKLRVMLRLRAAERALRRERDHLEETVQERTQELREAEYRFRTLFNAASDAIFFNDLEGRLLEVNDEACRLLGYRREELLRLRVTDLVPPEIAARRPELLKLLRAADHLLFETEHLCRDGGRIPIECSSRIIDFQGLPAVLSITRDISERQKGEKTLQEALSLQRTTLEASADGVLTVDLHGTIVLYNKKFVEMWGIPEAILESRNDEMAMASVLEKLVDPEGFLSGVRKTYDQPELATYDFLSLKDGRFFERYSLPQRLGDNIVGRVWNFRDITARIAAEERYSLLVQQIPALVYRGYADWSVDFADDKIEAVTGYAKADFDSRQVRWNDLILPEDLVPIKTKFVEALHADKSYVREYRIRARNGKIIWVQGRSRIFLDAQDRISHVSGVLFDISELKRAEEAILTSEERYRLMVTNTPNAVALHEMLFDPEGRPHDYRFLMVNPAFEQLTGLKIDRVLDKKVSEVLPGLNPFWIKTYGHMVITGQPVNFERYEEILKRYFRVSAFKTKENQFTTIFSDITQLKDAEERRLETMVQALEAMAVAIEMRDPYTSGHQRRVADLACAIAREMGLDEDRIRGIKLGGILHDIGKISVPAEILAKPGKINQMEMTLIRQHPQSGFEILKNLESPWPLREMVLQHHERLDGSGYPSNFRGEEIVLEAKILAVADVLEAMASHRPYRPALGIDAALEEISRNKGTLYDTEVVEVCVKLFTERGFHFH